MRRASIAADTITYNAAISACEKGQRWHGALGLLVEMRRAGIAANTITYSAAISACEKEQQWQGALDLFAQMGRAGITASNIIHDAVVRSCGKGQQWRIAIEIVANMRFRSLADADDDVSNGLVWAVEAAGAPALPLHSALANAYQKELAVLQFARCRSAPSNVGAAIQAIELFVCDCQWLKVAGGSKAELLEACLQPGDTVVECGTYIGFSGLVLVSQLSRLGCGGRIASCEIDAVVANIARAMHAWASAEPRVAVHV